MPRKGVIANEAKQSRIAAWLAYDLVQTGAGGCPVSAPNEGDKSMTVSVGMMVRLNSGGPRMTVQAVDGASVTCVWFDKATLRQANFLVAMIEADGGLEGLLAEIKKEKEGRNQGA